jgi:hypothetical protein
MIDADAIRARYARSTINRGIAELKAGPDDLDGAIRRAGGGRKRAVETQPGVLAALIEEAIRKPRCAGSAAARQAAFDRTSRSLGAWLAVASGSPLRIAPMRPSQSATDGHAPQDGTVAQYGCRRLMIIPIRDALTLFETTSERRMQCMTSSII